MGLESTAIEATAISAASKTTYGGALAGVLGWISAQDWITIIGVIVAVSGLASNLYFQIRRDRRESAYTAAKIEALQSRMAAAYSDDPNEDQELARSVGGKRHGRGDDDK